MKIEIECIEDLRDLIGVMDPEFLRTWQPALTTEPRRWTQEDLDRTEREADRLHSSLKFEQCESAAHLAEPNGLPTDISQPEIMSEAEVEANIAVHSRDADGVPHNTDWHSEPAKINADGRWRARRKRDEDAYKAWLAEQVVDAALAVAADAEPVATETHALPQDEQSEGAFRAAASRETASAETNEMTDKLIAEVRAAMDVDLAALVEASQEASLDASDNHMDLIKACQVFISDRGHPAYNALKAAVAPLEGAENGKAIPQFTPGERRLMRACMANYPQKESA